MALSASDRKSQLQFMWTQHIREFEQDTDMRVIGIKLKRDEFGNIESTIIKAEMKDDDDE